MAVLILDSLICISLDRYSPQDFYFLSR